MLVARPPVRSPRVPRTPRLMLHDGGSRRFTRRSTCTCRLMPQATTTSSSSVEGRAATPAPSGRQSWASRWPSSRRASLGGTCLHQGCIPTKALLHAAEVADVAREGAQFGVKTTFESVDMSGVNAYKDGVVSRLHKGLQGLVKAATIDYVEGAGRPRRPAHRRRRRPPPHGPQRRARDRQLREVAARSRDRRPHHDERAGARPSTTCRPGSSCSAAASSVSSSPPSSGASAPR